MNEPLPFFRTADALGGSPLRRLAELARLKAKREHAAEEKAIQ